MHFVGAPRVLRSASKVLEVIDAADTEISDLSSDDDIEPRKADVSDANASSSAESSTHKMAAAKWFDNKPILMPSAIHGKEPEDDCSRWFLNFKLVIAQTYLAAINTAGSSVDADDDHNDEPLPKRRKSVEIPAVPQRTSAAKHPPQMTVSVSE